MDGSGIIWLMRKVFYLIVSVSLLILAFSVAYFLVIFLPSKERAKQKSEEEKVQMELQKQEQEKKEYIAKRTNECYAIYEKEREVE